MPRLYAQGDILIERTDTDQTINGRTVQSIQNGSVIIAEGEVTGHRHRLFGSVAPYRDDALAREVPQDLYVGHVRVDSPTATLEHEEHGSIILPHGIYRVRRQRQLEPTDNGLLDDGEMLED